MEKSLEDYINLKNFQKTIDLELTLSAIYK